MKIPWKTIAVLLVLSGLGYAGYVYIPSYLKNLRKQQYRLAEVSRGDIIAVVNATGTVEPVLSVSVGSFVSGPIEEVYVDYNDKVHRGQVLAKIDPRLFKATVEQDRAQLEIAKADIQRIQASIYQAGRDKIRADELRKESTNYISQAELDKFKATYDAFQAQLAFYKATKDRAEAKLRQSETNLGYTLILSPVDGIVINKKVEKGQTVVSNFQTSELFIVAPDLQNKIHIIANVDEADIGLLNKAKELQDKALGLSRVIPEDVWPLNLLRKKQIQKQVDNRLVNPVTFTVDSEPLDLFEGKIAQIRMNSTTTQNVVTYPVVVETTNPDLKLKPGMTASLSFQVDQARNVLRIPNAALRFYPKPDQVRKEDRPILDGVRDVNADENNEVEVKLTASQTAEARQKQSRRHVWVRDGDFLRAVEVYTGLSDNSYTAVVSGKLTDGMELVIGVKKGK